MLDDSVDLVFDPDDWSAWWRPGRESNSPFNASVVPSGTATLRNLTMQC